MQDGQIYTLDNFRLVCSHCYESPESTIAKLSSSQWLVSLKRNDLPSLTIQFERSLSSPPNGVDEDSEIPVMATKNNLEKLIEGYQKTDQMLSINSVGRLLACSLALGYAEDRSEGRLHRLLDLIGPEIRASREKGNFDNRTL